MSDSPTPSAAPAPDRAGVGASCASGPNAGDSATSLDTELRRLSINVDKLCAAKLALHASCRELKTALAAAMAIISRSDDDADEWIAMLTRAGIKDGIGTRAEQAIRGAEL